MNVIYYLIPVAIIFVIVGVIAFFWATKSEQFEDLEKQGLSILMDDDELQSNDQNKTTPNTDQNNNSQI
ncbi:cbb3-type cytochrome oxidase assembly protein CcoS [Psychrosphaera sp. F3M07]|uniref:cbb3-type cytochrome oxidase assembly protein CcoS n=1 Tax=Psychrosphaera sp. F3M07 TaxID=2841560 RepID=UPI001C099F45|nr:cbb3-type cytochrome oxidase assembly protein CcoS [Psychrosphaera sp. F3M07]MBU2918737.1 cbb3-type cytochrome oxidase assembly protein CcoS [Psychrosphaera sp. F3M07]